MKKFKFKFQNSTSFRAQFTFSLKIQRFMDKVFTVFPPQVNILTLILAISCTYLIILVLLFSVGLYHALYTNLLQKYLQQLFFASKHFQNSVNRSILYLLLISFPMIILIGLSLFYNKSFMGIETSMTIDEINILLVTGYICWIEESRHTPIRGMHLIRDLIFTIVSISLYINIFYMGTLEISQPATNIGVFLIYYIVLNFFDGIEYFLLKIFGLKESNTFNAKFLLTSKHTIPDFLQIKDIISEKKTLIEEELTDYREILINLQENEQDQEILMNFAKLFLPIKKAYEIKEQMDNNEALKQIETTWSQGSADSQSSSDHQQQPIKNSPTWNQSSDGISYFLKHTSTDDFANKDQIKQQKLNVYDKFIKYAFYPVYLGSYAEGRLFYFMGYVALALLAASMFGVSNSIVYLSSAIGGMTLVSIISAFLLIYPSAKYFLQISTNNDYDFTNIFLQALILKMAFSSISIIIYGQLFGTQIYINKGAFVSIVVRVALLGVYLIYMIFNRFAARFNNFKYFCAFLIISECAKVIGQNVFNSIQ